MWKFINKSGQGGIICNLDNDEDVFYNVVNFPRDHTLVEALDTIGKVKGGHLKDTCMGIVPTAQGWGVRIQRGSDPEIIWTKHINPERALILGPALGVQGNSTWVVSDFPNRIPIAQIHQILNTPTKTWPGWKAAVRGSIKPGRNRDVVKFDVTANGPPPQCNLIMEGRRIEFQEVLDRTHKGGLFNPLIEIIEDNDEDDDDNDDVNDVFDEDVMFDIFGDSDDFIPQCDAQDSRLAANPDDETNEDEVIPPISIPQAEMEARDPTPVRANAEAASQPPASASNAAPAPATNRWRPAANSNNQQQRQPPSRLKVRTNNEDLRIPLPPSDSENTTSTDGEPQAKHGRTATGANASGLAAKRQSEPEATASKAINELADKQKQADDKFNATMEQMRQANEAAASAQQVQIQTIANQQAATQEHFNTTIAATNNQLLIIQASTAEQFEKVQAQFISVTGSLNAMQAILQRLEAALPAQPAAAAATPA